MRVLLSTYGSRGDVEPLVALAVQVRALGAKVQVCAPLRITLAPQTRARATAVAGTIRTDGATVAATLLLGAVSREKPPVSA